MKLKSDLKRFHDYMAIERGLSPRTALEYCRDVDRFQRAHEMRIPDLKPAKLTKKMRAWINGLMADGSNKPQSVHRKIAALHAYCKWLVREGALKKNPVDEIERPKCEKRLPKCMSTAQVGSILDARVERRTPAMELRDHAILEVMYGSGLRRAEVCYLSIRDVDFEAKMLHVVGKGNKERAVFLGDPAADAIRSYLATRPGAQPADALFLTQRGGRLKVRGLWSIFKQYREAAGVENVTPHTMRHSYATHMLENGADIVTLKELLGHSSIATTQTYTNVSIPHMRGTFERTHPRAKVS